MKTTDINSLTKLAPIFFILEIIEKMKRDYQFLFSNLTNTKQKIWITLKRGVFKGLHTDDILYIKSADHYIKIYSEDKKVYVIKASLSRFYLQKLSQYKVFYQLGRSCIVNLTKINKVENNKLFLHNGTIIPIPKNKQEEILITLGVKPLKKS